MRTETMGSGELVVSGRRPGRVQRIANDTTPLNARNPNIDARIGWLLAMSRLHHPEDAHQDGQKFLQALAEAGMPTSRSLLSRWESGEIPISYEAMSAYEKVLDLTPGRISSLSGYIRASIPGVRARVVRPKLDPTSREFDHRFDELLDLAEEGRALARDWQELGWHMSAAPMVHLRASTWETMTATLVNELPRSTKVAYRQYSTAAMNLASVPRAQDYLVEAIKHYITNPDVQVVTNPMGLLDRLPTRESARLVLDALAHPPNEAVFAVAVWIASMKVRHGGFSEEERAELDVLILRLWRQNPAKAAETLAELIANLPEGMRSTLVRAASAAGRRNLGFVVEHGEAPVASHARDLAHELADGARSRAPQEASYDGDRMLARLVREALFHRDSERRHLAALLISASPFGEGVADELLSLLVDESQPVWMRGRAATLVRYLSSEAHRMRMLGLIDHPNDEIASALTQGLGHMRGTPVADQALRKSLGQKWSMRERAKMYALGMTGSPVLGVIAKNADAPAWQRSAARWWRTQGPAIHA